MNKLCSVLLLLTFIGALINAELTQETKEIKNTEKVGKTINIQELSNNIEKSETDDCNDVEFIPVTMEHPLFKVFGINPSDYLIFYKHRKCVTEKNDQLDPNEAKSLVQDTLKITKKRDSDQENLEEQICGGCTSGASTKGQNNPLLFALMPIDGSDMLTKIIGRSLCPSIKQEKFPYMTDDELAGIKPSVVNHLGTGIYPVE